MRWGFRKGGKFCVEARREDMNWWVFKVLANVFETWRASNIYKQSYESVVWLGDFKTILNLKGFYRPSAN